MGNIFDNYERRITSPSLRMALEKAGVDCESSSLMERSFSKEAKDETKQKDAVSKDSFQDTCRFDLTKALASIRSAGRIDTSKSEDDLDDEKDKTTKDVEDSVLVKSNQVVSIQQVLDSLSQQIPVEKRQLIIDICDNQMSPYDELTAFRKELRPMTNAERKAVCDFILKSDSFIVLPYMEKVEASDGSFFWAYRLCSNADVLNIIVSWSEGNGIPLGSLKKGSLGGLVKDIAAFGPNCWCDEASVVEGSVFDKSFICGYSYVGPDVVLYEACLLDSICGNTTTEKGSGELSFRHSVLFNSIVSGFADFKDCFLDGCVRRFNGEKFNKQKV